MTRKRPRNVGASIRARLLNRSRQTGENFLFLLERYAAERFLYRLGESQHRERYVLKGAMLLVHWSEAVYRPTRDLDFTSYGSSSVSDVRSTIREISQTPVEDDGVAFDINEIAYDIIRDHGEYDSIRTRLKATLDYAQIRMQIDIGFGARVWVHRALDGGWSLAEEITMQKMGGRSSRNFLPCRSGDRTAHGRMSAGSALSR